MPTDEQWKKRCEEAFAAGAMAAGHERDSELLAAADWVANTLNLIPADSAINRAWIKTGAALAARIRAGFNPQ